MDSAFAPRRILILRTDFIGDVILTTPLIEAVKTRWPNAEVGVMVRPSCRELVEGNPFVSEVVVTDDQGRVSAGRLREGRWDLAVLVYPRWHLAWACWRAGIPRRVGTAYRWYSGLFTDRVAIHRRTSSCHEVELNMELLKSFGVTRGGASLRVPVTDQDRRRAKELLGKGAGAGSRPLVAVHPGSRGSAGNWPPEQYAACVERLMHSGYAMVITGGAGDEEAVTRCLQGFQGTPPLTLQGQTSIRELAAVYEQCRVVVSSSTGPMHVAAAVGIPTVSLFPHEQAKDPKRWGPWGNRAELIQPDAPDRPVSSIPVERVVSAVKKICGEGLPVRAK